MPIVVIYFLHQLTVWCTKTNPYKRTSCKICYWVTLVCGIFFEELLLSGFKRAARKERNISVAGLHVDKGEGVIAGACRKRPLQDQANHRISMGLNAQECPWHTMPRRFAPCIFPQPLHICAPQWFSVRAEFSN